MAGLLDGKVALVTGAASGIGRATALAMAREGANIVVADVVVEAGEETARLIREGGGEGRFIRADVSREAEVEALIGAAVDAYGRLDCAHNNAGVEGVIARTADFTEELWDQVIDVNLKGVWLCMKHEIRQMLAQGGGAIVNTASAAGLVGGPTAPYSASKHGVVGLTKSAAIEYARLGIRVNAVCPGVIRTPMLQRAFRMSEQELEARMTTIEPIGRLGSPEEVAEAVVWLCSDAASFVTGVAMPVDGGLVAR